MTDPAPAPDLSVVLGRLRLANPILVASGTFGYAREFAPLVDLSALGGVVPKTVTPHPRTGNPPPRTVETPAGMLNSIGLDNDGVDHFCARHLPYLAGLGTAVIANVAGKSPAEFAQMAAQIEAAGGADAVELNVSCPNVTGGVDYGRTPDGCAAVVAAVRAACDLPVLAKLTPNVTDVPAIAAAAADAGADALTLVNTFTGLAVDWKRRRPVLGNGVGGIERPGDQAAGPADRLSSGASRGRADRRLRRRPHGGRRAGVPRLRGDRRAGRHRELRRPDRVRPAGRTAPAPPSRARGWRPSPT